MQSPRLHPRRLSLLVLKEPIGRKTDAWTKKSRVVWEQGACSRRHRGKPSSPGAQPRAWFPFTFWVCTASLEQWIITQEGFNPTWGTIKAPGCFQERFRLHTHQPPRNQSPQGEETLTWAGNKRSLLIGSTLTSFLLCISYVSYGPGAWVTMTCGEPSGRFAETNAAISNTLLTLQSYGFPNINAFLSLRIRLPFIIQMISATCVTLSREEWKIRNKKSRNLGAILTFQFDSFRLGWTSTSSWRLVSQTLQWST